MQATRAATIVRLPRGALRDLKILAAREGKSLNRLFLEMARARISGKQAEARKPPRKDPIWGIGKDPWRSGVEDLAGNHDLHLYGPVTVRD